MSSCIPAFAKKGDLLVLDAACNEPILTGANLSRSTVLYFQHNDMADLERVLQSVADEDRRLRRDSTQQRRFIVVEGLYRNTGNIVPLPELLAIKEKYCYRVMMDESLSFGTLGNTGRGVTEHFGVSIKAIEIITVAMDTALASVGGLCVGTRAIVDHQRLSGAGYCFSASAPPFLSSVAVQALAELEGNPRLIEALHESVQLLWAGLRTIPGITVTTSAASPVIHFSLDLDKVRLDVAEEDAVQRLSDRLIEAGVGIVSSKFGLVNEHAKRAKLRPGLRVSASAGLSREEITRALAAVRTAVEPLL